MIRQGMLAGALLAGLVLGGAARADEEVCPNYPREQWLSMEQLAAKAKAMGYDVRSVKAEDGCWEIKGLDQSGKRVELYLDPVTAEIKKSKS